MLSLLWGGSVKGLPDIGVWLNTRGNISGLTTR
jgi:hypothetical protein